MRRWTVLLVPLLCLVALACPALAAAHPLGNFTINHYSRLEVQPGLLRIRYVLDEAEIPTYQDLALLQPGGGQPTAQQQQTFLVARVEQLRAHLQLTLDGQALPVALEPGTSTLSFPPGQGGLSLLRVTAWFRATLPATASPAGDGIRFQDDNYPDRLGWKEIVVRATDGAAVTQSSVPAVDQSDELRNYPQDMLASPLAVRSAQFAFTAAPGRSGAAAATPATLLQPRGKRGGFLQAATDAFTALVRRQTLSVPFLLFAVLAAMALGGVHALSPGHGKTVVGAYLVGARGTARQAVVLGLTVTVTHTAGVFALGLITLFASRYVVPERLYPWLSTLSGLLVALIGAWLLSVRLGAALRRPSTPGAPPAHDHAVALPAPDHAQRHDHGGHHSHDHGVTIVEHDHGTGRHRHPLPAPNQITGKGLLALGISGGLLPCPSALVVLLAAISLQRVAFGILLVIAFSVGLAGVLTGIGLLLVYARDLFTHYKLELGLGRLLPAASAAVVLALGLAITLQSLAQSGLFA